MNGIDIDLSESLNSSPGTETGEEQEEDGPLSVQYALLLNRNCFDEIYSRSSPPLTIHLTHRYPTTDD